MTTEHNGAIAQQASDAERQLAYKLATTTTIEADLTIAATHNWPKPCSGREYLASEHRHLFHVRAEVLVTHDERDIEFHDLGQNMAAYIDGYGTPRGGLQRFGAQSCETLARRLFTDLTNHGLTVVSVRWSEDNEFSATIRRGNTP